jgi:hypothetical protein
VFNISIVGLFVQADEIEVGNDIQQVESDEDPNDVNLLKCRWISNFWLGCFKIK